jgi:hypothetical protein
VRGEEGSQPLKEAKSKSKKAVSISVRGKHISITKGKRKMMKDREQMRE